MEPNQPQNQNPNPAVPPVSPAQPPPAPSPGFIPEPTRGPVAPPAPPAAPHASPEVANPGQTAPAVPPQNTSLPSESRQPASPTPPATPVVSSSFMSEDTQVPNPPLPPSAAAAGDSKEEYKSNPFLNSLRGLVLILKVNPVATLLSGLLGLIIFVGGYFLFLGVGALLHNVIALVVLGILAFVLMLVFTGACLAIAGASARNEVISFGEAFGKAGRKLLPLIVLGILVGLGSLVGLILLITPGVIFFARASLASLVLFEEDLGPVAAIKRSMSLTKGHVNEMLGAIFASQLISGGQQGLLLGAIGVAPLVGRYQDLRQLQDSGAEKPKVHWLNYSYLFGIILGLGIVAALALVTYNGIQQQAKNTYNKVNSQDSNSYDSGNLQYTSPSDPNFNAQ